jgi:acyl dehydratase
MSSTLKRSELTEGLVLPTLTRETDLAHWNRYAAINDEFIPIHMDPAAAKAAGQPDVFGMGNLRIAYLHAVLDDWLDDQGDIAEFECQFRSLNFKGDVLTATASVSGTREEQGRELIDLELAVMNQNDENTTPGRATLALFKDGKPDMPEPPAAPEPPSDLEPGTYLDEKTLALIGRPTASYESLPVCVNDIRRWAMGVYYPEESPARYYDEKVAARGAWGGLVAPRDFNPFAWMQGGPRNTMPWMRGIGTEPGHRILNGGRRAVYYERIRPGDVITSQASLVNAYEREGKLGTMLFLITETRWTNQDGRPVTISYMTTIYY